MAANHSERIIHIYDDELNRIVKFVLSESIDEYYHVDCYIHDNNIVHNEDGEFIFAFSGVISSSLSDKELIAQLMHIYNQQNNASDITDYEMDVDPEEYNNDNMEFETSSEKEDYMVDTTVASFRLASSSIFNMNIFARPNISTVEPIPSTDSSSATNEPAPLVETYSHIFGIRRQMPSIPPIEQSQESSSNANHYNSDEEEAANSEPKPKNARFN